MSNLKKNVLEMFHAYGLTDGQSYYNRHSASLQMRLKICHAEVTSNGKLLILDFTIISHLV